MSLSTPNIWKLIYRGPCRDSLLQRPSVLEHETTRTIFSAFAIFFLTLLGE